MPTRILLVDDHEMLRQGLRSLLEIHTDMCVVGEKGDGEAAVLAVRKLHPDIVIMDIAMPGMNGIEATRRITDEFPQVRVVCFSMHLPRGCETAEAGAVAFLSKDSGFDALVTTIYDLIRERPPRRAANPACPGISGGSGIL